MMRLPSFRYRAPRTVAEAALWLAESPGETMLLAGGTDLLPNMKRRQQTPKTIVGLRGIEELSRITSGVEPGGRSLGEGGYRIGAGVTLTTLVRDEQLRATCPGLWQAAAQVATPHLRTMGTLGGNLCLDTRCTYYDQTYEWRKAIDFCMKKDGETCWVATSSPRCLAVSSTDTAPMLQALDARVRLVSASGERELPVADLYENDGMQYLTRRPDEILTEIVVPDQTGWRSAYWKLRRRGSFDFPVASVAAAAKLDGEGRVLAVRLVAGAVASRPLGAPKAEGLLVGDQLTDERIAAAAHAVYTVAKPMDNTDFELVWRKKMVTALATCALKELRGDDVSAMRIRMTRIGLWACALMLVLARVAAAAQTSPPTESAVTVPAVSVMLPNYNTVPIGEVASLEAGAFVARADDASAGFYNTAGLARAKRTSISGSAGAFQFGSVSPEGLTNVKGTFQQIPSMFGLVVNNLLGHQTLAGGFSIARVNAWTQAVEVESVRPGMIGSNRFRFSTAAEFDAWQASVGVAYERGDRLRLGASIDGQYTWAARRQSIADQFTTATGLGALTANSIGNLSVSHLRATLASQIEITPSVHLGLVMRTRGLGVTASGSASLEGLARVGGSTVTSSFFDPDASVEYRLPSEFKGGLAWLGKRAQIEADVSAYSGRGQYQLVETANTVTTITDNGQGTPAVTEQRPYVSPAVDSRAVVNVALGGHYNLSESGTWTLHGGYATDRSPVGANDTAFTRVHLQKVTVGMSARTRMFLGSLGLQYANGRSDPLALGTTPDDSVVTTRFKVSSFGLVYSVAVQF